MILLDQYNIIDSKIHYNTDPKDLTDITVSKDMGNLTSDGTLSVNTGKFTWRSPRDRYIVKDQKTKNRYGGAILTDLSTKFCSLK